jgi:hypothetical protein
MKLSQESIILICIGTAIAALIIWKNSSAPAGITPAAPVAAPSTNETAAPYYTQYNANDLAAGYNLPPPLSSVSVMPAQTMGIAGAVGAVAAAMGCKSCQ